MNIETIIVLVCIICGGVLVLDYSSFYFWCPMCGKPQSL